MKSLVFAYSHHWRQHLAELLKQSRFSSPLTAASPEDLRKALELTVPELLFVVHEPPFLDALTLRKITGNNCHIPSVFVSASLEISLAEEAAASGYASFMVVPSSADGLNGAVVSALAREELLEPLRARVEELERALSERKLIEKAKGLLMERERISEDQAFRMMRAQSMKSRSSMAKLAEEIIGTALRQGLP